MLVCQFHVGFNNKTQVLNNCVSAHIYRNLPNKVRSLLYLIMSHYDIYYDFRWGFKCINHTLMTTCKVETSVNLDIPNVHIHIIQIINIHDPAHILKVSFDVLILFISISLIKIQFWNYKYTTIIYFDSKSILCCLIIRKVNFIPLLN